MTWYNWLHENCIEYLLVIVERIRNKYMGSQPQEWSPIIPTSWHFHPVQSLTHCTRVGLVTNGRSDGMPPPILGYKILYLLSWVPSLFWISHFGGRKLLYCKQPYGGHMVKNWSLANNQQRTESSWSNCQWAWKLILQFSWVVSWL